MASERLSNIALRELFPTRSPVEGFVRGKFGFHCSISSRHTNNLSLFW